MPLVCLSLYGAQSLLFSSSVIPHPRLILGNALCKKAETQVSPYGSVKILSPPAEIPGLSQVPSLVQRLQDSLHILPPNLKQRLFSHRSSPSRLFALGPNKQSLSGGHKTTVKPVNTAEAHLKYMMHAMFSVEALEKKNSSLSSNPKCTACKVVWKPATLSKAQALLLTAAQHCLLHLASC